MTDRVHEYLDGVRNSDALTPAERDRSEALGDSAARAAAALRSAPAPDLTARVMAKLPAPAIPRAGVLTRILAWLWTPRALDLTVRPAYAFAGLAAAAFALVLATTTGPSNESVPPVAATTEAPRLYVQFRFEAAAASTVELAGSFTEWQPAYELEETTDGVWSVMIPLQPGVHDYTFVVDGEHWIVDPNAPRVSDSFGGSNSRLFLPPPTDAA